MCACPRFGKLRRDGSLEPRSWRLTVTYDGAPAWVTERDPASKKQKIKIKLQNPGRKVSLKTLLISSLISRKRPRPLRLE